VASYCECGFEPRNPIKCGEFREALGSCQLFKNDSAPWNLFGRTNKLTVGNKCVCHTVLHIGLTNVLELNSCPWRTVVFHKLMASFPVNK